MLRIVIIALFFAVPIQGMETGFSGQRETAARAETDVRAGAGSATTLHFVDGVLRLEERLTELPDFESCCDDCDNVIALDCANNILKKLSSGALSQLPNLEKIILPNNPGLKVMDKAFAGLPKLREIHLADCGIDELPDDCFEGCPRLERLLLSGNRLRELPASLRECRQLKELDLRRNGFEVLPDLSLLRSLEKLNLDKNMLSDLDVTRLPLVADTQLTYFSCCANQLEELPLALLEAYAERSMEIRLQNNPFFDAPQTFEALEAYRLRHDGVIEAFDPDMAAVLRGDREFAGFVHDALHRDTADKYLDMLRRFFPAAPIGDLRTLWERQHPVDGLRTEIGDGCALVYRHRRLIFIIGICVVGGYAAAVAVKKAAAIGSAAANLVGLSGVGTTLVGIEKASGLARGLGCAAVGGVSMVARSSRAALEHVGDTLERMSGAVGEEFSRWNLRREIVDVSSGTKKLYRGCGLVVSQLASFKQYMMTFLVYIRLLASPADDRAFRLLQREFVESLHLRPEHQIRLRCESASELFMVLDQLLASNAAGVARSYAPGGVYTEADILLEGFRGDSVQMPVEFEHLLSMTRRISCALGRIAAHIRFALPSQSLGTPEAAGFIAESFASEGLSRQLETVVRDSLTPIFQGLERNRAMGGADVRVINEWIGEIHHLAEYVTALHTYALGLQRLE